MSLLATIMLGIGSLVFYGFVLWLVDQTEDKK